MSTLPPERDDDGGVDVEAAWAQIVAHWDAEPPPVGPWSASEDTDDPAEPTDTPQPEGAAGERGRDTPRRRRRPKDATPEDTAADAGEDDWGAVSSHVGGERAREEAVNPPYEEPPEEGYVPPEPPPLPRPDLLTALSWAGAVGAPVFFLFCAVLWRSVPQLLILAGLVAFVAGACSLVLRMPSSRGPDDDDGAVV